MAIAAVLCDIEGTTTSLAFVQQVLFPLSRAQMQDFIESNWGTEPIAGLHSEISPFTKQNVVRTLRSWIDSDVKHPILKAIQGMIWKESFESGRIRGHVYPDVPEYFRKWKSMGLKIAIFSSGSVEAQKLLFRYSEAGDLSAYIDAYFDTSTGPKKEPASYAKITTQLNLSPRGILFLSDVVAELDAAAAAGMITVQLLREEGIAAGKHRAVQTFAEINL